MNYTFDSTVDDGLSFTTWLRLADRYCIGLAGVGLNDLPDTWTRDAYDCGDSPRDHVDDALANNGFPFPEGHRYHVPAPAPARVWGGYDVEHIRTEGGKVIVVERNRAANGKHGRTYLVTQEEIDREING